MAVPRGVALSLPSFVALPMAVYLVFVLWGSVDAPRYLPGVPFRPEGSIVARVHRRASRKLLECLNAQVTCLPDEDVNCQKASARTRRYCAHTERPVSGTGWRSVLQRGF